MSALLPFIVIGVTTGCIYGMAAVGLVVTYKTSGVFNFAHGALATLGAYLFYFLHVEHGMAWPLAAVISVVLLSVVLGLGLERLGRVLMQQDLVVRVLSTVGILLLVEAACTQKYGATSQQFPPFLSISTVRLFGTYVQVQQIIIVAVSVVVTVGLYLFLRIARAGKAMRAVVDDASLLGLSGTRPSTVRRLAWTIGCFTATIAGLLLAPSVTLDSDVLTLLVVQAFGAAAIGRFSSLPVTWLGGLVIGVAASILTKYVSGTSVLGGLPAALPFVALFLVLLLFPKRWMTVPRRIAPELRSSWRVAPRLQWPAGAAVVVVLALMPSLVGFEITNWTVALTDVTLLLSLGLLVRTSRQISLCHAGFAAIGAVAFSKFATGLGLPWLPSLILSGVMMVPIGALIAIPAIRLSGLYLALATLGFGMVLQNMFYQTNWMFGETTSGLTMPRPSLSWLDVSSDKGFYYVVLLITVILAALVVTLDRGRFGRLLRGIGESTTALATNGATTSVTQVLAFCIAAFIAGISGALLGIGLGTVTGTNFDPMSSLLLAAVVLITPGGVPWYALFGGLLVGLLPDYFTSQTVTDALQAGFGLGVILHAFGLGPRLPARLRAMLESKRAGRWSRAVPSASGAAVAAGTTRAEKVDPATLDVEHVTVRFGGQVALSDVSLKVPAGSITGLIGPNGAGKTTLFNVCSGLLRPAAGSVALDGRALSRSGPAQRARAGLGRTFQHVELCESLTVADNVAFGREAGMAGAGLHSQVVPGRADDREVAISVRSALELCGIADVADRPVQTLTTGQRRLVELARCIAGPFRVLLLDEPSSGLNEEETGQFSVILQQVVAERGVGVLLVEHDMSLVMTICSYIHVLDFGQQIFSGTPDEVRVSDVVRAAYLGKAAVGSALEGDGERV